MKKTNTGRFMRTAGMAVLCGTLAFSSVPTAALAEATNTSLEQSQPGEPPSGEKPDAAPGGEGGMGEQGGTPPDGFGGGAGGEAPGGMGGADTMTFDYSGTYSGAVAADGESVEESSTSHEATEADVNAALVQNGGALALTGVTLAKSGDDTNGDNCNFYGVNSIALTVGEGSLLTLNNAQLSATSEGSNGVFATDSGTAYVSDTTISTTAGNSRGLDATYGGTIIADGVTISTQGEHSASIATDRGGGSISVTNSELSTAGSGSPLLYSTGDIEVSGVTGTASGSQIAGMEGLNTILINNSQLTSTNTTTTGSDPVANGVIIYQSTSGDAEATTGDTATFQSVNSTLASAIESGSMFYLTNTSADVVLQNTVLDFDSTVADLLLVAGNDSNNWGTAGSNGATVRFTGIQEELAGNIEVDAISSADVWLTDGTTWTGAGVSEGRLNVSVDGTSSWVVTADSTVSNLTVANGAQVVDAEGKTVSIVTGGETVVSGDSDLAVTVTGSYSTEYDASDAGTVTSDVIDRTAFDEATGKSTAWAMGSRPADADEAANESTAESTSTSDVTAETAMEAEDTNPIVAFFSAIADWFAGLFK